MDKLAPQCSQVLKLAIAALFAICTNGSALAKVDMITGAFNEPGWSDFYIAGGSQIYGRDYSSLCLRNHGIFGNGWNSDYDGHIYLDGENIALDSGCGDRITYVLANASRALLNLYGIRSDSVGDFVRAWPTQLGNQPLTFQVANALAGNNAPQSITLSSQGFVDSDGDTFDLNGQLTETSGRQVPFRLDMTLSAGSTVLMLQTSTLTLNWSIVGLPKSLFVPIIRAGMRHIDLTAGTT